MQSGVHTWSKISTYFRCPRAGLALYSARSGLARTAPTSEEAIVGDVVHAVIESVLQEVEGIGTVDLSILQDKQMEVIRNGEFGNKLSASGHAVSEQFLQRWLELWNREFLNFRISGVEQALAVSLPGTLGFRGRVDLVAQSPQGTTWVIDWKTGKPQHAEQEQVEFYSAFFYDDMKPHELVVVAIGDVRHAIVRKRTMTRNAVEIARRRLTARIRTIEADMAEGGIGQARPNQFCTTCPQLESCPEGTKAVEQADFG